MKNMLLMLYPMLEVLGAMGGVWGAEMCRGISPNASEISQDGKDLYPMEAIPKVFLANRVRRIHEEHAVDVISNAGVAGGKGWLVGC